MNTSPTLQDGAELRRRRIEAGVNVSDLATATGLHESTIRLMEREKRGATPRSLGLLAGALGCKVKDLLRPKLPAAEASPDTAGIAA